MTTTWPTEGLFIAPPGEATALGQRFADAATRHAVVVDPAVGLPVLLRRQDHARVFRDPETFSTRMFAGTVLDGALAALQGAEHTRMRRVYNQAFNGAALRRYEEAFVAPLARSLVARLRERGEVDLLDDFAMALPRLVLAELLEVDVEDIVRYDEHVGVILAGVVGLADPELQSAAHAAHAELLDLIGAIVERTSPTSPSLLGEIVGALAASGDDLREPTEQVVLSLLLGGFETTSWLLANMLGALLAHPEVLARVRADLTLAPQAVTESIRW
jgi:cytochrome P450